MTETSGVMTGKRRKDIEEMAAAAKAGAFRDVANDLPLLRRMLHEHTTILLATIDAQQARITDLENGLQTPKMVESEGDN